METMEKQKHTIDCMICGRELVYFEDYKEVECMYCHKKFKSNVHCVDGHYICDSCHAMDALGLIETYCRETDKTNPMDMAIELMKNPAINMHGPEHHFLVPAVLVAAYYNYLDQKDVKIKKLAVAKTRAKDIKGGFCGFYGNCGAAVGAGIYVSIILGATPLTKHSWGLANLMTGTALITMADIGGPRCCKRNLFIAISEAVKFTHEHFNVKLYDYENHRPVCSFSLKNKQCLKAECPYYAGIR